MVPCHRTQARDPLAGTVRVARGSKRIKVGVTQRMGLALQGKITAKSFFLGPTSFELAQLLVDNHTFTLTRRRPGDMIFPYAQHPWIHKAAATIAVPISQVPFIVEEGDLDTPTLVTDPAVVDLFDNPNPQMRTTAELWESTNLFLDLTGNCMWLLEGRDSLTDLPDEIWPRGPQGFEPKVDAQTKMIDHWIFRGPKGDSTRFEPHEVVHFKLFNPRNQILGLSRLESALMTANTDFPQETLRTFRIAKSYHVHMPKRFFRKLPTKSALQRADTLA